MTFDLVETPDHYKFAFLKDGDTRRFRFQQRCHEGLPTTILSALPNLRCQGHARWTIDRIPSSETNRLPSVLGPIFLFYFMFSLSSRLPACKFVLSDISMRTSR